MPDRAGDTMRPMSRLARRPAGLTVLLLSLAIVAVLGMQATGIGLVASPTPVPATATPQPAAPASSQDVLPTFDEIERQVVQLRGLPAADIGPPELMTRAELARVLPSL